MTYETILFSVDEGIGIITFNRPKALNAINSALLDELSHVLDAVKSDDGIRVLILTGAGEKAFVAGADISELAVFDSLASRLFSKKGHMIISKLQELPIPVITAANGFALGGGSEIALASDFIYASSNAKFGFPEINLGLIPGFGGTQRMSRLIGTNTAKEMIFTGKLISADEALRIGMVNRVCTPELLMEEVYKTAREICSKGRVSLRAAKHAINTGMNVDIASGCEMEINEFALCFSSEDAKEGTAAFLEKRKAEFKGKLK
ncbi:MAG: enoyl-CoA hydratase-related protein [Desulfobacterales bacterium]